MIGADGITPFLARAQSRAVLPFVAALVLLLSSAAFLGREIERHMVGIEAWTAALGPWAVLGFVGLFAIATSLLVPESLLSMAAGAVFGLGSGLAVALAGSLLAGALQYALARRLLRARIERALAARPPLAALQRAVLHDELRLQALLRLAPLNPATISYALGAAGVRFPGFVLTSLAVAPHLFVEVYFGHVGVHVARSLGSGASTRRLQDLAILAGLAAGVAAVMLLSRMAREALTRAVAAAGPDEPGDETASRRSA
jgi:uncharacterized membrane protein YdjX (TVP38/TMEM64 family)